MKKRNFIDVIKTKIHTTKANAKILRPVFMDVIKIISGSQIAEGRLI